MRDFVADAHRKVIGDFEGSVRIPASTQVEMVRHEGVALMPPLTLPVQEVGALSAIKTIVGWTWILSAVGALLVGLLGLFVRPERGEFTFALGATLGAAGVALVLFGWLVPATMLGAVSDEIWTGVFARLAGHNLRFTLLGALILVALGGIVVYGTTGLRVRRGGSTPLAATRYRSETRSWSS